jgi:hypothetical protein
MAKQSTKTAAAAAETETTQASVPATVAASNAPPAFFDEVEQSGKGVSNAADDKLIPMARVLQPLSPQVLNGNPDHIAGALAGDILVRNAPKQLIKGQQGFLFQSCYFYKDVVQWKPRLQGGGGGQGLVTRHKAETAKDVPGAEERPDPRDPTKKIWVHAPSGDWLVETRYHVGYVIDPEVGAMPCYIPFSSTGHSVSKAWMFSMSLKQIGGKPADSFAIYYLLRTRQRTRNNQTWFVFDPQDAGPPDANGQPTTYWAPTKADYMRGLELARALESGELGLADEDAPGDEAGAAPQQNNNQGAF